MVLCFLGGSPPAENFIREGKAEVLPNCANADRTDGRDDIFYNPAQVFNRDLSVVVLSVFAKIREAVLQDKWEGEKRRFGMGGDHGFLRTYVRTHARTYVRTYVRNIIHASQRTV